MNEQMDERPQRDDKNASQDEADELHKKAKMRSNEQSARCATQNHGNKKKGGQFGSKPKDKQAATEVTATLAEDVGTAVPVFALKTQLPPSQTQPALSSTELAAFLSKLEAAYKAEAQTALKNATSEMSHGFQSSSADGIQEREDVVQSWQQASASAVAAIELIQILSVHQTAMEAAMSHKCKRKRIVPETMSTHKSDRRAGHVTGHHHRDEQRS